MVFRHQIFHQKILFMKMTHLVIYSKINDNLILGVKMAE